MTLNGPDIDVIIVGAGLSGIGAAVHLIKKCPNKSFRILEARDAIGGTWDLFRYPGVRSDSDMHTLGFRFKPWTDENAIAGGTKIRRYISDTADEYGVTPKIQFRTKVVSAEWQSTSQMWYVTTENTEGTQSNISCRFLYLCGGYYSYDQGYLPDFPGREAFMGEIVHPQQWPESLNFKGKRVIVIGSGATAVTLVPALAKKAKFVTMLQRSPTYVVSLPSKDAIANKLHRYLPDRLAYRLIRWKNVLYQQVMYFLARRSPEKAKEKIVGMIRNVMGPKFDVETHFTPKYNPWDQRLCLVPDNDLFKALKSGFAEVVTDQIETFTQDGIALKSGRVLNADIIVTATGLNLLFMNGIDVRVDGSSIEPSKLVNYKGVMFSNIPNLAVTFGYTNASWTLKADLTAEYVCRLINYLDKRGYMSAVPHLEKIPEVTDPFSDFSAGYIQRVAPHFPRQHRDKPWRLKQSYLFDLITLRYGRINDGALVFKGAKKLEKPKLANSN